MTAPAFLGRRRRRGGVFNPLQLFANGEAGVFYDPGDLTAEKVVWRRNLLTWSEDFTNAAWTLANPGTRTANTDVAPDGTTTADTITDNIVGNYSSVRQAVAIATGGAQYRGSVYAKKTSGATSFPGMTLAATGGSAKFASVALNTDTGVATARTGEVPDGIAVQDFGTYWRVAWTITTLAANTSLQLEVAAAVNTDASATWSAATQGSAVIWGAMLAPASVDPTYQRITDFTSDFLAAFPTHALYQDSAGTTPVTALGQPVGLALDKSRGALASIGPELVTNGTFATNLSGWTLSGGIWQPTWASGRIKLESDGSVFSRADQTLTVSANRTYRITFSVDVASASLVVKIGTTSGASDVYSSGNLATTGSRTVYFTAATSTIFLRLENGSGAAPEMDNVSVREVPGVHAIQATSASREALDARVNLLTYSEQFDNAAWTKRGACTVTANAIAAPDGTMTADLIAGVGAGGVDDLFGGAVNAVSGAPLIPFVYIQRVSTSGTLRISNPASSGNGVWLVNLATLGSGWQAITAAHPAVTVSTPFTGTGAANSGLQFVATAGGPLSFYAWGADLRLATDAAYPYQRVVTATDYADVGVPRSFLHDGFDDSSYTASSLDLSGTDKVTVWAGVYKNSDAASGMLAELTANSFTTNGAFSFVVPDNITASGDFAFYSRGTTLRAANSAATLAPVSRVMTGIGDISGDVATLRLNGVQAATNTGDQGTGNYANAVLNIGRRNNASLPFNGKIYCIIIRGAATDAATLALTERYVGSRMGIVL